MSLISFLKDAGEKLMHRGAAPEPEAQLTMQTTAQATDPSANGAPVDMRPKEQMLERAILDYMVAQDLPIQDINVLYESASATITVSGAVPDQQTREKMILCCGNVQGVEHVNDALTVGASDAGQSQWYTVQSGDSLSKIAQNFYGDSGKHEAIFEANQPMLSDPNRIYPGQTLRIPQQA